MRALLSTPLTLCLLLSCAPSGNGAARPAISHSRLPLNLIHLPPGFKIDVYADDLPNARQMALSPQGILYVGSLGAGKVYAVVDSDKDGRADKIYTVASGLKLPSGLAWRDGALYIGAVSKIVRLPGIDARLANPPAPETVSEAFPKDEHHGWKFLGFGPDGKLYVPVGAPCNLCDEDNPIYASITRIAIDREGKASAPEIYARGVRNTVGFDWHPQTHELWFTDNGRDMLGDDMPPDELNRAPKAGLHFGFPYCHGGDIADPKFGAGHPCSKYQPPVQKLGPHVASIGMRFYTGTMFPAEYRNQVFIAEHGSWNRSTPIGYRVTVVKLDAQGKAVSYQPFAEGWLQHGDAWGRPADVLVMPDGALLVSDDHAGVVYRITYAAPHKAG
ncbi:MAG TPA: sorbosone dehydrogenase family protein [Thermoanaerobaculia bacterium]|jgi:glucose/arabinose dehydrogenase|nr:sorbosone dehydrogenase family protein [Thermoanaerobaculia bacterium]